MQEPQWEATSLGSEDVPDNGMVALTVAGRKVILLRDDNACHAYVDACPHEGFALSRHGERQGFVIVCKKHLWEFDAETGEHISRLPRPQCNLRRFPVREADGRIEIDVSPWPASG